MKNSNNTSETRNRRIGLWGMVQRGQGMRAGQRGVAQLLVIGIVAGVLLLLVGGGFIIYTVNKAANEQPTYVAAPPPKLETDERTGRAANQEDLVANAVSTVQSAYSAYQKAVAAAPSSGTKDDAVQRDARPKAAAGFAATKQYIDSDYYTRTLAQINNTSGGSQPSDKDPFGCEQKYATGYTTSMSSTSTGFVIVDAVDVGGGGITRKVTVNTATMKIVGVSCPSPYQ